MELSDAPEKIPGIDPGILQLVAQCLNHYATPGPWFRIKPSENSHVTMSHAEEQAF